MLRSAAARHPGRTAIRAADRRLTYAEVDERADRLADVLRQRGVVHGDRVGILLPNRVEYLEIYYGIARAGAACIPLLPRLTEREVNYQLADAGAVAVLVDPSVMDPDALACVDAAGRIVVGGHDSPGYESLLAAADRSRPELDVAEEDAYCVRYTSGTTGKPKGSVNSQRAWWLVAQAMVSEWSLTEDDVMLANGPFSHVSGMISFAHVAVGAQVVLHERFDVDTTIDSLLRDGITNVFMVPTQFTMVVEELERRGLQPAGVRTLMCAAAPLTPRLKRRISSAFPGAGLHEFYSATETPMVTNLRPSEQATKAQSVGLPRFLGGEVRILDEAGEPVPHGEVGQVWVSNPMVHIGYHDRPDENKASMKDRFMTVGDLGRVDEDGYLYIVGRKSDMIISGGLNVYPNEVEDVMSEHEAISEVSVFGVGDDRWGEQVRAAVILRPGATLTEKELDLWCRARLADYKVPRRIEFVAELPRLSSGKVLRRALSAQGASALDS
jgi:long-chain acyl-CoA synthetase